MEMREEAMPLFCLLSIFFSSIVLSEIYAQKLGTGLSGRPSVITVLYMYMHTCNPCYLEGMRASLCLDHVKSCSASCSLMHLCM